MRKEYLKNIKRIVIKIGTKSITENLIVNLKKVSKIVKELSTLHKKNYEIILVSSGAIASGIGELGLNKRPKDIPDKQAAASIGQITLMSHYYELFKKQNVKISQVLLTESDLKNRVKYLNARNTLLTLITKYKVIPIINENDVVGIEEIIFGDNDVLSALIANLINADLLILLTNTDGFFINENGQERLVCDVKESIHELLKHAGHTQDEFSTGGMKSKIQAVKIVTQAGISAIIANSQARNIIEKILQGQNVGTFFCPCDKKLSHKKRWIAFSVAPEGKIYIDQGAREAIKKGKSLLPSGIIKVEGIFNPGSAVDIFDAQNKIIGRGITNYNKNNLLQIMGKRSGEIKKILPNEFYEEVIHCDNLVIYE